MKIGLVLTSKYYVAVDLIDMQSHPDSEYNFILNYEDHLTKFCIVRPLVRKIKESIAAKLVTIFSIIGSPHILQSDNGREFVNQVVLEVVKLLPGWKIVNGKE